MSQEPSVQTTFRKVIDAGYYVPADGMCTALWYARSDGVISWIEYLHAKEAITSQLCGSIFMRTVLKRYKLAHSNEDLIHLYRNWDTSSKILSTYKKMYSQY